MLCTNLITLMKSYRTKVRFSFPSDKRQWRLLVFLSVLKVFNENVSQDWKDRRYGVSEACEAIGLSQEKN